MRLSALLLPLQLCSCGPAQPGSSLQWRKARGGRATVNGMPAFAPPSPYCSRGYGTVRYETAEEAQAAIEHFNGSELEGRTLSVRLDKYA